MNKHLIKKIAFMVVISMATINAFCVPAKRVWKTMMLADGTKTEVMLVGDEHGHWYINRSGKALRQNAEGLLELMSDSQLTQQKAKRNERLTKSNAQRVQKIYKTRALSAKPSAPTASETATSAVHKTFGSPTTFLGKKKGLVILVNYSDKKFLSSNNRELFDRRFNEEGYSEEGCIGSVHDYFYDQSYGQFDINFDVVGPVTVSKSHDYYGSNVSGNDKYPATMVIEALKLVDDDVDFSQYDWDGDKVVDQVFVIYAGNGEAASGNSNDIWPHEWELSSANYYGDGYGPQTLDGVKIDTYAVSCELAGSGNTIDGIGTACHEFAHCLGYADLYDLDSSGGQGMQKWDVLDIGSYNGPNANGEVPPAFTSFERWWAGWMDLTVLDSPTFVKDMPAINDEGVAYKIVNDNYPDEYYLLENRQAKRWDSYTACNNDGTGHGMLILHVDYDKATWESDAPNDDPKHQRMTFIPADNSYGTRYGLSCYENYDQMKGDVYPGTSHNTSLTDSSQPAATLYNANSNGKKFMGKPVTDISESNGLVSFTFMGGISAPKEIYTTELQTDGFVANWASVEGADAYDLELTEYEAATIGEPVFTETFSKTASNTGDGTTNISTRINTYTDNNGWTASTCYTSVSSLKIGSSKATGYVITPTIASPDTHEVTVKTSLKGYSGDNTIPVVSVLNTENEELASAKCPHAPSDSNFEDFCLNFSGIDADYMVKIASPAAKKRFYIGRVDIYDGKYSIDDISDAKSMKKAASATTYISGITDTSYTLSNLNTSKNYKYRVRATIDGKTSPWSDYVKVLFTTSIADIEASADSSSSRIYNLNGQYMGTDINALPAGIYIYGTRKVVKK